MTIGCQASSWRSPPVGQARRELDGDGKTTSGSSAFDGHLRTSASSTGPGRSPGAGRRRAGRGLRWDGRPCIASSALDGPVHPQFEQPPGARRRPSGPVLRRRGKAGHCRFARRRPLGTSQFAHPRPEQLRVGSAATSRAWRLRRRRQVGNPGLSPRRASGTPHSSTGEGAATRGRRRGHPGPADYERRQDGRRGIRPSRAPGYILNSARDTEPTRGARRRHPVLGDRDGDARRTSGSRPPRHLGFHQLDTGVGGSAAWAAAATSDCTHQPFDKSVDRRTIDVLRPQHNHPPQIDMHRYRCGDRVYSSAARAAEPARCATPTRSDRPFKSEVAHVSS